MSDDVAPSRKIFHLPPLEQVSEEERNRRIMGEVGRLAALSPGEWKLWYRGKAEQLGIEPDQLAELIEAQITADAKATTEKLKQDKLGEQKAERQRKAEIQKFRERVRKEDSAAKKAKTKTKAFIDHRQATGRRTRR